MNLLIDMWATSDGKMKVDYMRQGGERYCSICDITRSWLSMVYRFKNFTKKDKERIESFFTELQRINDNGANDK